MQPNDSGTRLSLLGRLFCDDQAKRDAAWVEFVDRYGSDIYAWFKRRVTAADAEDLTQEILRRLFKGLPRFDPDKGRFRDWLYTIVHNTFISFKTAKQNRIWRNGDAVTERLLGELETRQDLLTHLSERFDLELLDLAKDKVRRDSPDLWRTFSLLEEHTVDEVSKKCGISRELVYKHKERAIKAIQKELEFLRGDTTANSATPEEGAS